MEVSTTDLMNAFGAAHWRLAFAMSIVLVLGLLRSERSPKKVRDFFSGWVAFAAACLLGAAQVAIVALQGGVDMGLEGWLALLGSGAMNGAMGSGIQSGAKHIQERRHPPLPKARGELADPGALIIERDRPKDP